MAEEKVYALVLAGGRSSRMGADKALLNWGGETLLERAVRFWRESGRVERILVSVGPQAHFSAAQLPEGVQAVADLERGRGPMAGLAAAFACSDADVLCVGAVDMPNLTAEAVLPVPKGDAAVYRLNGRREPLFGVYRRSVLPAAQKLLAEGKGKMGLLLDAVQTEYYYAPPLLEPVFQNLNTPGDALRARAGTPPAVAVVGWHNAGKTTFLRGLIPALTARGVRVTAVKHDAHGFEMDHEDTDTWHLRRAGAEIAAILGPDSWAVLGRGERTFEDIRRTLPKVDLILAEGFKYSPLPKLEIHRKAAGHPLIVQDETLLTVLTDELLEVEAPQMSLTDFENCADLLCRQFDLPEKKS